MKCTTEPTATADGLSDGLSERWAAFEQHLPAEWEALAYRQGALVRRRGVRSVRALLQLILAYSVGDWSLRQVGLWASLSGVATLSDVALLKRLRQSLPWLSALVSALMQERIGGEALPGVRLCLMDATSLSCPGTRGTDWRLHVMLDVATLQPHALTLTDVTGGEGFQRLAVTPDMLLIADRAYGYTTSVTEVLKQQAGLVVRMRWPDLARYQYQGQPFQVIEWLRSAFAHAPAQAQAIEVQLSQAGQTYSLRLVACPLPLAQAQAARRRVRRKAQKNQVQPTQATLFAAGFVLLLTNLPSSHYSAAQVGALYRLRWQVELYFKRLKSLMHLDQLRAHDPQLAQVYLLAKVLAALVLDRLSHLFLAQFPAGLSDPVRPFSRWRLTALLWSSLQGLFTLPWLSLCRLADPLSLRRYLWSPPRKRPQQDAYAQLLARSLSVVNVPFIP